MSATPALTPPASNLLDLTALAPSGPEPTGDPLADAARTFAERMARMLNEGALALMVSIGHRTGLFDALAGAGPLPVEALAARAGCDARYVREWLGAMTTGRVVEHDPRAGTYALPDAHAASLTRAASPANVAVSAQFLPVLGAVEDEVVACFRAGGGVPYAAFTRFHEVMAEESAQTVLSALLEAIVPLVPGLEARLEAGVDVLDVGCGRGRALLLLARRFPRSRFAGYDLSPEAIAWARAEARRDGLHNVRFEVRDAARGLEEGAYDLVTAFDAIHDQADPAGVLAQVRRALRAGGAFLMQDIGAHAAHHDNLDHPIGTFLYTVSCLHCMTVSLAQGGAGLGAAWGVETAERMLEAAGFVVERVERLEHDAMNVYFVAS